MTQDILDDVMTPNYTEGPKTFFGRFDVDVHHVVLTKGVRGGVPFDASQHKAEQRCTAIDISIAQLDPSRPSIDRNVIAESKEWAKLILPSLQALGVTVKGLVGKYVRVESVPTGQKYTNAAGEEKERTTLKFVQVFESADECQEASDVYWSTRRMSNGDSQAALDSSTANAERDTAKKFLPALWKRANNDIEAFGKLIAGNPIVSRHFDLSSPEVIDLVGAGS